LGLKNMGAGEARSKGGDRDTTRLRERWEDHLLRKQKGGFIGALKRCEKVGAAKQNMPSIRPGEPNCFRLLDGGGGR